MPSDAVAFNQVIVSRALHSHTNVHCPRVGMVWCGGCGQMTGTFADYGGGSLASIQALVSGYLTGSEVLLELRGNDHSTDLPLLRPALGSLRTV